MKNIILGITGGVAAYKSVELVRCLRESGYCVRVVMTQNAQAFVTPLCFQAISGQPVFTDLMDQSTSDAMAHISLARWADIVLIAPASANTIAKIPNGIADDLLTTICLATEARIVIAPAMNKQMWENHFTQNNLQKIQSQNIFIIGPESGEQACGEVGFGRMTEPLDITNTLDRMLSPDDFWRDKKVLITAGTTHEAIDPIRFIANKSSGKMGYALAKAAQMLGAKVVLVSGPTQLPSPVHIQIIRVTTAQEMYQAVFEHVSSSDIFIGAAAVANYRVAKPALEKIKSNADHLSLDLISNPDIIKSVAALSKHRPFVVGFAAETENLIPSAKKKMARKNLDMIIANQVGEQKGMGTDTSAATIMSQFSEDVTMPEMPKTALAELILREIRNAISRSKKTKNHYEACERA